MLFSIIEPRSVPQVEFAVNFTRSNYEYTFPSNAANLEIVYIQSGTLSIKMLDQEIKAQTGSFLVLPHKYPMHVASQKDSVHIHYSVCIRCDSIIEMYNTLPEARNDGGRSIIVPVCLPPCPETNTLLIKMKSIITEFHSSLTGCSWKSGCMALDLLFDISRAAEYKGETPTKVPLSHILCYRTKTYIAKNIDKQLSVSQIAKALGKTPSYLSHVFREVEKTSILQYINREKITRATELIVIEKLSLQQAAKRVGINDPNYFSRMFRKQIGLSLSEYLRNSRESTVSLFADENDIQIK